MGKKTKPAAAAEEVAPAAPRARASSAKLGGAGAWNVLNNAGEVVRTYSVDPTGDRSPKESATEFAEKLSRDTGEKHSAKAA